MADDKLKIEGRIKHSPSNQNVKDIDTGNIEIFVDMDGTDYISGTQSIGSSSEEAIAENEVATAGYVFIRNLDDTNFVLVGLADVSTDNDARPIKLKPGEIALFRANGDLNAKADTAAVRIQYYIFED